MAMEVVIFACQQAVPDLTVLRSKFPKNQARLRVLSEPCSSKVEAFQLLRTLATPVDLVWVIGCAENLCRYQEGSHRLSGRVKYSQRYLEEIGMEPDRLGYSLITPAEEADLSEVAAAVKARLKGLGESRLKAKG